MHPQFTRTLLRKLGILTVIVLIVLSAGVVYGRYRAAQRDPHVESFDVERGHFVAETVNIRRMEVWYVPPHSGSDERQWKLLGKMQRSSHWFSRASWKLPIPERPLPAMQIFVRAYDDSATEVDRVSLPWIGERVLREHVWGAR